MTDDRNPVLNALFDQTTLEFDGKAFTNGVMSQIDRTRRWSLLGWFGLAVVFITCTALLAAPLVDAVSLMSQILPESLIDFDDAWLGQLLSPVNSLAGLLALSFLGLRMAYRKIFA